MNSLRWRGPTNSLRYKLTLSVLVMTLPLVCMLFYNNFYAIQVVRGQVADSYTNTLNLYMNQIDSELNDADAYMNTIASGNDLLALSQATNDDDYYTSRFYIYNKLTQDIALNRSVNAFFIFEKKRQDYIDITSTSQYSYEDLENMKQHIIALLNKDTTKKGSLTQRWQYYRMGEEHYLINIVQSGNAYLGAWIRTDWLVGPLSSLLMGKEGEILFANDQGEPITDTNIMRENSIQLRQNLNGYYLSGSEEKYLVIGQHSKRGNFSLVTLIPDKNILDNLPYLQQIIWIITIGSLLFIPFGLYMMRRAFLIPLNRILLAMKKVRGGDWATQVDTSDTPNEFKLVGDSFNSMMNEIQTLRVNVFEEQLNKQKEELHRLQLQVNPHFFLNALNIVYNLAKVKNFELILQMTEALIHYFRFLFRSATSYVKLKDELEHTRNYLYIQTLRFPGQLTWTIDVPDYLTEMPVPPLVIQSFVENTIKHAVTMDDPVDISIKIRFMEEESSSRMKISISDTGCGFSDPVLRELQAGRSVQNEKGEHTGIWNVERRLRLLYDEPVSIQYANDPVTGGAVVEMIVPTNPKMEDMT